MTVKPPARPPQPRGPALWQTIRDWRDDAACIGRHDLADAVRGDVARDALALCWTGGPLGGPCPVMQHCYGWARSTWGEAAGARDSGYTGVAGGTIWLDAHRTRTLPPEPWTLDHDALYRLRRAS